MSKKVPMIATIEVGPPKFDVLTLAIRETLHFYHDHLHSTSPNPPSLVMLSDDRRNREIAQQDGLLVSSTKDYVDGLLGDVREALVDLVVGGVDEMDPSERRGRRIYHEVSGQCRIRLIGSTSPKTSSLQESRVAGFIRAISTRASTTISRWAKVYRIKLTPGESQCAWARQGSFACGSGEYEPIRGRGHGGGGDFPTIRMEGPRGRGH